MSLSYLYMGIHGHNESRGQAGSLSLSSLEVSNYVLTLYLGSSLHLIWPFPPMLSSVPTLRFSLPQPRLPNLPNAMRLNFPWTQGSRQPHLLVTHWLTRIRLSGSLSSHIIQGFPPCTLSVTPLHFFLECCPERRLRSSPAHIKQEKWQSHPVVVA